MSAAARLSMDTDESQFVIVAVVATLQTVDVSSSPERATEGTGADSGQSNTVAVETVFHFVAVSSPRGGELHDDDSANFST